MYVLGRVNIPWVGSEVLKTLSAEVSAVLLARQAICPLPQLSCKHELGNGPTHLMEAAKVGKLCINDRIEFLDSLPEQVAPARTVGRSGCQAAIRIL